MDATNQDSEIITSDLGKLSYWEDAYLKEIENYSDHGDTGEVWFGENVQMKVIHYITDRYSSNKEINILDVGTGNGALLFALAEEGFTNLNGSDFSPTSIAFCQKQQQEFIERNEDNSDNYTNIHFFINDFIHENIVDIHSEKQFDIVHDKGTFDAILLHPDYQIHPDLYYYQLLKCLAPNGIFIITSCNNTEAELIKYFVRDKPKINQELIEERDNQNIGHLIFSGRIPHRQLSFGGSEGSTVTTIIFKKETN